MSKLIKLTRGKVTVVDDEDFDWLNKWKWYATQNKSGNWYAVRHQWIKEEKKHQTIRMHRLILNCPEHLEPDHINGDGFDNRRENLRAVDHITNCHNGHKLRANKTSKYQGVHWNKRNQKWVAQIRFAYRRRYLGSFKTQEEAQKVYMEAKEELCSIKS